MKLFRFILFLAISFISFNGFSQAFVPGEEGLCIDKKANLYIAPSTSLYVDGNLYNKQSEGPLYVRSNGVITLTGNLTANDPLICERADSIRPTSQFIFQPKTGIATVTDFSDSLFLYHTIVNKAGAIVKINSGTNLRVLDTLDLQAGSIQLDGGNIYFSFPGGTPSYVNHPWLKNENNDNRIFGDSGQVIINVNATTGYEIAANTFNFANMGLILKGPDVLNSQLSIKRGHAKQIYAGNGSIARYFDVTSNQALSSDTLIINYIDSAEYINLGINKNNLKPYASHGDDMNYIALQGNNNLAAHTATANTFNFLLDSINATHFRVTVADSGCLNPPISALPAGPLYLCAGNTATLDAGNNSNVPNTSLAWKWNTGATTQTININTPAIADTFIVILRDVRGCITKDSLIVLPAPNPVASIHGTSACYGDSAYVNSTSTISSGSIVNYAWSFGDNTSASSSINDTLGHVYAASGNYTAQLIVFSDHGCSDTAYQNLISMPLPTASFTSNFNCADDSMYFINTSSVDPLSGSITHSYWNFDTLNFPLTIMDSAYSPSYHYNSSGTYWVKLSVKTGYGCKDSITQQVTILPRNQAAFNISNSCAGDTLFLNNASICNSGNCNYSWDFGDGSTSIASNPLKIFTTPGTYNIKLLVTSAGICPDSVSHGILIHPKPVVSYTAQDVCLGQATYFTNNSNISTGSITSYLWNDGNSGTASSFNFSSIYGTSGTFNSSLTATSDSGCIALLSIPVNVFANPTALYSVQNVCLSQPSVFQNNSNGNSLSYQWDFGNTITSTQSNPSYTYTNPGTYNTTLTVTDINGCSDTSAVTALVNNGPQPSLGGTISTCGSSYTLDAGSGQNYLWQPSNNTTQTITVTNSGTYSVTVTDNNGCSGSDVVTVNLNSIVNPNLGPDTSYCGNKLLNAGYPGSTYFWNDGSTNQQLNATSSGTYYVTVTDQNNCTGTDTVTITINALPSLTLGPDITQCQNGNPVVITPTTNASSFNWSNGSSTSSISVSISGYYSLIASDANGCAAYDTIHITLNSAPVVNLGADATVCGSKLLDAHNNGFNYSWSTGSATQTIIAQSSGNYFVTVTNPSTGCSGADTILLSVSPQPILNLGSDTTVCSNNLLILNAGNPGYNYSWSTGATTQSIQAGSSGTYGVTINNGVCSAFDAITINIQQTPVANIGPDIAYLCGGGSVTLNANAAGTYSWYNSNGFVSSASSITVSSPGFYWLTISNNGCSSSDTVNFLQSNLSLTAEFLASTVDTVGKPVKFVDVSQPVPTSWHWDFGDGFYSTEQSPEHTFLMPQAFNVSLTVGNGFCSSQITKSLQIVKLAAPGTTAQVTILDLIKFNLYPNPNNGQFQTVLELNDIANISVSIYSYDGKLIYSDNRSDVSFINETTNLPTDIAEGLYFIDVLADSPKGFVRQKTKFVILK